VQVTCQDSVRESGELLASCQVAERSRAKEILWARGDHQVSNAEKRQFKDIHFVGNNIAR
jgi:hypothetical protein